MVEKRGRRVEARRPKQEDDHTRIVKMEHRLRELEKKRSEEEEYNAMLMDFFGHMVATIADLRDSALISSTGITSGNIRESLETFFDAVVTVCDTREKVELLKALFPDKHYEIDALTADWRPRRP